MIRPISGSTNTDEEVKGGMDEANDEMDEAEFDGVHIILGQLQHFPNFSMEASLVVRGSRFSLDEAKMEGVSLVKEGISGFGSFVVCVVFVAFSRRCSPN